DREARVVARDEAPHDQQEERRHDGDPDEHRRPGRGSAREVMRAEPGADRPEGDGYEEESRKEDERGRDDRVRPVAGEQATQDEEVQERGEERREDPRAPAPAVTPGDEPPAELAKDDEHEDE